MIENKRRKDHQFRNSYKAPFDRLRMTTWGVQDDSLRVQNEEHVASR
jgi:hypothetical protein